MAIKVLMLLHNLRVSAGVSSYVMNYFRAIDHSKIHIDFAIWSDIETPYYKEIAQAGSKIYVLPPLKLISKHLKKCERILSLENYDIVHDNTLLISYPIMHVAKRHNVPVRILHSHNSKLGETRSKEFRNRAFLPFLKQTSTDYAACSDLAARALFGKCEYDFIPNIILDRFLGFSEEKRISMRTGMKVNNKVVVGTVGRAAIQKNPLFAIDVMEKVIMTHPEVEYWWIGSGPMDETLKRRVEQSILKDGIKILGSRSDVPNLYQAIDVFFLPSLFEGLPVTGVEAQAMGLPSVVSDTVTKEMVYTDLVEFVPLDAPIESWVKTIEKQMKRIPERRSYMKELENSVFSSAHAGERLEEYYRRLLRERL